MKKIVGILIVILLGVCLLKPKEKEKLDNVILKQEVNNKTFAMYKEEGDSYVPVVDTKFPEGYALNVTKSNCIDNNGNEIKDALSYENGEVTITSGKTIYCYLYFDKTLGVEIKEKEPKGLKTDAIRGAMYRYQGQAKDENNNELVNNYICFGTSDLKECTANLDKYMYRIIGIEASTGRVKVIKKEALNKTINWYDNYDEDIEFPKSNIYNAINGEDFLKNKEYIPNGWIDKISDNTWIYGDMRSIDSLEANQTGEELYKIENGQKETQWYNHATPDTPNVQSAKVNNEISKHKGEIVYYTEESGTWTDTFTGKVSLMYLHDYYYSVSDETNSEDCGNDSECKTSWIYLSQNDINAPSCNEWTMSRYGWDINGGWFVGHDVGSTGYTGNSYAISVFSVRPVFYLTSVNQLSGGIGTLEDPFIIKS